MLSRKCVVYVKYMLTKISYTYLLVILVYQRGIFFTQNRRCQVQETHAWRLHRAVCIAQIVRLFSDRGPKKQIGFRSCIVTLPWSAFPLELNISYIYIYIYHIHIYIYIIYIYIYIYHIYILLYEPYVYIYPIYIIYEHV